MYSFQISCRVHPVIIVLFLNKYVADALAHRNERTPSIHRVVLNEKLYVRAYTSHIKREIRVLCVR